MGKTKKQRMPVGKSSRYTQKRDNKTTKAARTSKIKKIVVKPVMTDDEIAKKEGHFFDVDYYTKRGGIYSGNVDCYITDPKYPGGKRPLFHLRTGCIPDSDSQKVWDSLSRFAMKWNDNRGAAAGIVSSRQLPKHARDIVRRDKFRVVYRDIAGHTKKGHISNRVRSNIIGYYDMPDRNRLAKVGRISEGRAPKCRETAWVRDNPHEWRTGVVPIVKSADKAFKSILPGRHSVQQKRASRTPDFQIANTAYSTVTVNYNYRSACHRDAGDLEEGFGNLVVIERNKVDNGKRKRGKDVKIYPYTGGYLGFPQYGIAVDVRHGDYLAMDVHEWHCNTPIISGSPMGADCPDAERDKHCGRMSLVFYLRKGMLKCAS